MFNVFIEYEYIARILLLLKKSTQNLFIFHFLLSLPNIKIFRKKTLFLVKNIRFLTLFFSHHIANHTISYSLVKAAPNFHGYKALRARFTEVNQGQLPRSVNSRMVVRAKSENIERLEREKEKEREKEERENRRGGTTGHRFLRCRFPMVYFYRRRAKAVGKSV